MALEDQFEKVTQDRVIPLLLDASPSFTDRWERWLTWWEDDDDADDDDADEDADPDNPRGNYNDVAQFAHHLVECFDRGDTGDFVAVFDVVEQLITGGDEGVKDIVVIGLIDDVQTISSHKPFGRDALLPWCGPFATEAWAQVIEMWRGKQSLSDVIRAEGAAVNNQD